MLAEARPKESRGVLETLPNTFVIPNGILYDYYSIKFGERRGDFVEIRKLPPILKEGFVTFQKQLYRVTLRDFLRSRVNVGQPAYNPPTTINSGGAAITASDAPATNVGNLSFDTGQPGLGGNLGLQIEQAANLAWEDQIRALFYSDDPEEEWKV